ncbi:hypothetical protein [Leisingera methylohalidivorans]|nr:hypothetical protein [Leisingera methylohalidivorans]
MSGLLGFNFPFSLESFAAPHLPVFVLVVVVVATMPIMTLGLSAAISPQSLSKGAISAVIPGFVEVLFLLWDTARSSQAGGADIIWVALAFGVLILHAANTVFDVTKWPVAADAIQVAHAQACSCQSLL